MSTKTIVVAKELVNEHRWPTDRQLWRQQKQQQKQQRQSMAELQEAVMQLQVQSMLNICARAYFSMAALHWNNHFVTSWTTNAMTQFLQHKYLEVDSFFSKNSPGRNYFGLGIVGFVELVNKRMPLLASAKTMIFDLLDDPAEVRGQDQNDRVFCIIDDFSDSNHYKSNLSEDEYERAKPWLLFFTPTYEIFWSKTRCHLRLRDRYYSSARSSFEELPLSWKTKMSDKPNDKSNQSNQWFVTSYNEVETFTTLNSIDAGNPELDSNLCVAGPALEFLQELVPKRKYSVEYQQPIRPQSTLKKEVDGAASTLTLASPWFNGEVQSQGQGQNQEYFIQQILAQNKNPLKQQTVRTTDTLISHFQFEPYLEEITPYESAESVKLMDSAVFVQRFELTQKECRLFTTLKSLQCGDIFSLSCNVGDYRVSLSTVDGQKQIIVERLPSSNKNPSASASTSDAANAAIIDIANIAVEAGPTYVPDDRGLPDSQLDEPFVVDANADGIVYFDIGGTVWYSNPVTRYQNNDEGLDEICQVEYNAVNEQAWLITLATILEKACERFGIPKIPVQFTTDNGTQIRCETSEGYQRVSSILETPPPNLVVKLYAPATLAVPAMTQSNNGDNATNGSSSTSITGGSSSERITTYVVTTGGKKILEFNLKKDGVPKIIFGIRGETITEDGQLMGSKGAVMMTVKQLAEYQEEVRKKKMSKKQLEAEVKLALEKEKTMKKTDAETPDDESKEESKKDKIAELPKLPTPALVLLELEKSKSIFGSKSKIAQSKPMQFAGVDHFCKFSTDKSGVDKVYPLRTFYKCATKRCTRIGLWGEQTLQVDTINGGELLPALPLSLFTLANLSTIAEESEPLLSSKPKSANDNDVETKFVVNEDEGKEEKKDNVITSATSASSAPSVTSVWIPLYCVACSSKLKNARLMDIAVYVDEKFVTCQESTKSDKHKTKPQKCENKCDSVPIIAISPIAKKPVFYIPGSQVRAEGKFNPESTGCEFPGIFFFCTRDRLYDYVFHSYPRILQPGCTE